MVVAKSNACCGVCRSVIQTLCSYIALQAQSVVVLVLSVLQVVLNCLFSAVLSSATPNSVLRALVCVLVAFEQCVKHVPTTNFRLAVHKKHSFQKPGMRTAADGQVSLSASVINRNIPSSYDKVWKPVDTCRDSSGGLNNLTASPKREREKVMESADPQAGSGSSPAHCGDPKQEVQMDDYEYRSGKSESVRASKGKRLRPRLLYM